MCWQQPLGPGRQELPRELGVVSTGREAYVVSAERCAAQSAARRVFHPIYVMRRPMCGCPIVVMIPEVVCSRGPRPRLLLYRVAVRTDGSAPDYGSFIRTHQGNLSGTHFGLMGVSRAV